MVKRQAGRRGKSENTGSRRSGASAEKDAMVTLYGLHAVRAAMANPRRTILRMMATLNATARLGIDDVAALPFPVDILEPREIDRKVAADAVHQGVVVEAEPLPGAGLEAIGEGKLVLLLDQITDPHNVGAILRSAAAFDAGAVITTERHSPSESGVLAKSASGALDLVPYVQISNLGNALRHLQDIGYVTIGLDSDAPETLEEALSEGPMALVMGAEGKGLRHKTRQLVDHLARLSLPGKLHSLNVSNAAAVALYAATCRQR